MSSRGRPRFSGPKATSSATRVITIWSSGSWKTTATFSLIVQRLGSLTGTPSIRTSPSVGYWIAVRSFTRVLFPEPLWPIIATRSPESIERSRPRSAGTASPSPVRYAKETPSSSITAPPAGRSGPCSGPSVAPLPLGAHLRRCGAPAAEQHHAPNDHHRDHRRQHRLGDGLRQDDRDYREDRKSTRLNSSHAN